MSAQSFIHRYPNAKIIDREGRKMLPIGRDGFVPTIVKHVFIDKTMLIADVLDSGYTATLFCRPRRFGKTLNMTMLRAFFEIPAQKNVFTDDVSGLFEGTDVWEAGGGRYREHQGAYPVVYFSFNTVKKRNWEQAYAAMKGLVRRELYRHDYLFKSNGLDDEERGFLARFQDHEETDDDYRSSLTRLIQMLGKHHDRPAVLLVDEYDAPVMASYSAPDGGYYHEIVDFLKGWLTGAIKDGGEALAFACLTGVQRISKESIFSDLNNLSVSTSLSTDFDERFGFSDSEVAALADYLGFPDCMDEMRRWYDGYCFGGASIYNPWSVLNYFKQDCAPRAYWGNTSSNDVLGAMVKAAGPDTMDKLYALCEQDGAIFAPLDLSVVFPDGGMGSNELWSMLYLAGYLTTDDGEHVEDELELPYRLRLPNREIAHLYKKEIIARFTQAAGGTDKLYKLHEALREGKASTLQASLEQVLLNSVSYYDLQSENSVHMLLVGLLYGAPGYEAPMSNREQGRGRFNIRLAPTCSKSRITSRLVRPYTTIEVKFLKAGDAPQGDELDEHLDELARKGLEQIAEKGYDEGLEPALATDGRLRWGIAVCGKRVRVACERA